MPQSNNGLPEDALVGYFDLLPNATIPAGGGQCAAAGQTCMYFAIYNGLCPDVPDSAHGDSPELVRKQKRQHDGKKTREERGT